MSNSCENWAEQLRCAAMDIMDHADDIVSDIGPNVSLDVRISLHTNDERFHFPRMTITREVVPSKAVAEKIKEVTGNA